MRGRCLQSPALILPQRADGGVGGALGAGCALGGDDGDAGIVVDVFAGRSEMVYKIYKRTYFRTNAVWAAISE